jgi:hypothetical protein
MRIDSTIVIGEKVSSKFKHPSHHPVLVLLVAEHPIGSHNVLLWTWHQAPHFVSLEVVEVLLHGQHPVRILQGFFYPERLNRRTKGVMLTEISQSLTSSYSLADVTKDLIHRMIPLNSGLDLSWRCP